MANKAIQYTIYPDEKRNELCQKTFGCVRFVYNQMLTVQQDRHKTGEKLLSKLAANAYCNWYPYDADDTEDDKQDAIDSFARAKLNLELGEYSEWELDYLSWLWRKPI